MLALDPELALAWSAQAMDSATTRVNQTADRQQAFVAIGEAVSWITIVNDVLKSELLYIASVDADATLKNTLAGLRYVRNSIGNSVNLVDFVQLKAVRIDLYGDGRIAAWSWKSVPAPRISRRYEAANHLAYETTLLGRTVVEAFTRAQMFLDHVLSNRCASPAAGP